MLHILSYETIATASWSFKNENILQVEDKYFSRINIGIVNYFQKKLENNFFAFKKRIEYNEYKLQPDNNVFSMWVNIENNVRIVNILLSTCSFFYIYLLSRMEYFSSFKLSILKDYLHLCLVGMYRKQVKSFSLLKCANLLLTRLIFFLAHTEVHDFRCCLITSEGR